MRKCAAEHFLACSNGNEYAAGLIEHEVKNGRRSEERTDIFGYTERFDDPRKRWQLEVGGSRIGT